MIVTIVGHGTSPVNKGRGDEIDRNTVVRLKDEKWEPRDFGKRCDYRCASTETMMKMLECKPPKAYWAQPKRGHWDAGAERRFRDQSTVPLIIPLDLFLKWNTVFKDVSRETNLFDAPNFSLGMFSIIASCEFLRPTEINLVGFDNMMNPALLEYHKADRGKWVSRHDWFGEKKMLPLIEHEYGVKISDMATKLSQPVS